MTSNGQLLQVNDLQVQFGSRKQPIRAVDGVTFSIPEASTVALVGESGCGKSVTALSLARLIPSPPADYAGGSIVFNGRNVLEMRESELSDFRGKEISYVFQEPSSALNPVFRVGYQVMEAIKLHRHDVNPREEALKLLGMVGLPDPEQRLEAYPHELSGGMQQRVMIAMALACRPKLLVADEPTTALDVTIQAQILELIVSLQCQMHMAVLLITHNLGLVADVAHEVYVMYAGRIVESGRTEDVLTKPSHPYTRGLLDAVPRMGGKRERMTGIDGSVPHPGHLPTGCKFAPRCPRSQERCRRHEPQLTDSGVKRSVRCYFPL